MNSLRRTVLIAILGALSFLLMWFGEFPIPALFAEYLKYDPGDVPAVVATYTLGPAAGFGVELLKALIFLISGKSTAGWVGVLANLLAGGALVAGAAAAQRLVVGKSWAWGVAGSILATLIMTALLIPLNALIIFRLWGMDSSAAWSAALVISTPFNLFKGFVSSIVGLAFYRRLQPYVQTVLARNAA